jgi:cytochrome c biogenesis protein CcmG/thiol:disulfide interchange protein DsbE
MPTPTPPTPTPVSRPRRRPLAFVVALAAVALAGSTPARAGGTNLDGRPAPELSLACGLNGISPSTTLASLRGKVVLLKFWLTRCPVCRGTLPEFQDLHDRYGKSGVVVLGVVEDVAAGVSPYLKEAGWTFGVACDPDGRNAALYGVNHYPANYVIGIDGVVRSSEGFSRDVILEELRKQRVAEWGSVPAALRPARDLVEDGDYGGALKSAEAAAAAAGATDEVKKAVARLQEIAKQRQDNRLARADELVKAGKTAEAKAEYERIASDFQGTSLAARAQERLKQFLSGAGSK